MSVSFTRKLKEQKQKGEKIIMLTAYDYITARLLDDTVDLILVGDSLGHIFSGYKTTLPVTIDEMIYHTKAVVRGASKATVVADMPFMSYHVSLESAKQNAGRLMQEAGAHAVKIEINEANYAVVPALTQIGIPVIAHLGLTPQSVYQLGGYREQAKTDKEAELLLSLAIKLEQDGCFAILLEQVSHNASKSITKAVTIPVIGIGAGSNCDGQVLVTHDLVGLTQDRVPKFAKQYDTLGDRFKSAIAEFAKEVKTGKFPQTYSKD